MIGRLKLHFVGVCCNNCNSFHILRRSCIAGQSIIASVSGDFLSGSVPVFREYTVVFLENTGLFGGLFNIMLAMYKTANKVHTSPDY